MITTILLIKLGIVLFLSCGANYLLIKYTHILKIIDIPNERSSHTKVVPRSGGIGMFAAFTFGIFLFDIEHSYLFLIPLSGIFLVGLWDDIRSISSKKKLFLTACAAIILYQVGFDIQHFGTFLGHEIVFNYWVALLFFAFAISGFVSSINLIDGLDGLASVVSLAILFPFAYIGYKYADTFLLYSTLILMSAIGGFLILNWHPAKIFMGDSGSMFLGFMISIIVVYSIQKDYITAISTLLLCAIPILDTLIVMLRRVLHHHDPLAADKTHIHHLLLKQQCGNTRKTVLLLGLMQILFSYIGLGFKVRDDIFIFILYSLCFILLYFILTPMNKDSYYE
jgi:UDP-GlcNAc:undecaprenyl-phosphate GlcNAc-1-phosphate transferase